MVACMNRTARSYYCLDINSEIGPLSAGASAAHRLSFRSYAIKQIQITVSSECKNGFLRYQGGAKWQPGSFRLPAAGIGRGKSTHRVETNLTAVAKSSGQRAELEISAKRELPRAPIEALRSFPVHVDIS
jgi:hypothetical protein